MGMPGGYRTLDFATPEWAREGAVGLAAKETDMSICQIQVNSPSTISGVNLLPGTYAGEEHRRRSVNDTEPDDVTYTLQLPVQSSGDGTMGSVQTLDVTTLVRSGSVTVIM